VETKSSSPLVLQLLDLPWSILVTFSPGGGYFARVVEIPGCMVEAESPTEAVQKLKKEQAEWLSGALNDGKDIPEPKRVVDLRDDAIKDSDYLVLRIGYEDKPETTVLP
jgi:predicted RNase H-like HicB family nuclease